MKILRYESFIAEANIEDAKIKNEISHFYDLQRKIKELELELDAAKEEFRGFEQELRPMMDSMKEVGDKLAKTEEFIIQITRFGGERKDASYKAAFELALTKVNAATKNILQESLEASRKVTQVKHSFTIDKITEGLFGKIGSFLKKAVSKFLSIFKKEGKKIDDANDDLEAINAQINEKAYQLSHSLGAKGIPGKVLFSFKKEVEKIKYEGNAEATLAELNEVWSYWADRDGAKIIKDEVEKFVRDEEAIVYIIATLGKVEWEADQVNNVNVPGRSELLVRIPSDFVINVGFADDVDASRFSKKLGGYTNTAIPVNATEVVGTFDKEVGYNNIEIRSGLFLTIDAK